MQKYEKKFLNISEQINLLKNRGLVIDDENKASFYLEHINYYHFSFRLERKVGGYKKIKTILLGPYGYILVIFLFSC